MQDSPAALTGLDYLSDCIRRILEVKPEPTDLLLPDVGVPLD